jgi:hypothetical protein
MLSGAKRPNPVKRVEFGIPQFKHHRTRLCSAPASSTGTYSPLNVTQFLGHLITHETVQGGGPHGSSSEASVCPQSG